MSKKTSTPIIPFDMKFPVREPFLPNKPQVFPPEVMFPPANFDKLPQEHQQVAISLHMFLQNAPDLLEATGELSATTLDGIRQLLSTIQHKHRHSVPPTPWSIPSFTEYKIWQNVMNTIGGQTTITGKGTYVGSFLKRLSKFLATQYKILLTNDEMNQIGNHIGLHETTAASYPIEIRDLFTKEIDWKDGEFGDPGSCFISSLSTGQRNSSIEMLHHCGFYAIKLYNHNRTKGIGRAWMLPIFTEPAPGILIFNAYGPLGLTHIARLVSRALNMSYKQVYVNSKFTSQLYTNNSGMGVFVSTQEMLNKYTTYPRTNSSIPVTSVCATLDNNAVTKAIMSCKCEICNQFARYYEASGLASDKLLVQRSYKDKPVTLTVCKKCADKHLVLDKKRQMYLMIDNLYVYGDHYYFEQECDLYFQWGDYGHRLPKNIIADIDAYVKAEAPAILEEPRTNKKLFKFLELATKLIESKG